MEAFSPGSIVVDYYLVFKELPSGRKVTTQDLKDIVDVETKQTDSKNMLGNLRIDPTFSDFIGEYRVLCCGLLVLRSNNWQ